MAYGQQTVSEHKKSNFVIFRPRQKSIGIIAKIRHHVPRRALLSIYNQHFVLGEIVP